tara:strand:+ start:1816 stop:1971 length:156 start_codon:yes stop_codon:yes gene_type:complete
MLARRVVAASVGWGLVLAAKLFASTPGNGIHTTGIARVALDDSLGRHPAAF